MRREEAGQRWKALGAEQKAPFEKQPGRGARFDEVASRDIERPRSGDYICSCSCSLSLSLSLSLCLNRRGIERDWGSPGIFIVRAFWVKVFDDLRL